VVYAFDAGGTAEEIVQQYPSLSLGKLLLGDFVG
jgi:uncharacterized protein (DUF433 family)